MVGFGDGGSVESGGSGSKLRTHAVMVVMSVKSTVQSAAPHTRLRPP